MKTKFLILASQDYEKANHKGLWDTLSKKLEQDVIIVNIPADKVVSKIKKHTDRITEAKSGPKKYGEHLTVIRPLLTLRPELVPTAFYKILAREFWREIEKQVPDILDCQINILVYNAFWVKILKDTRPNLKFAYYLYDEVRRNGNNDSIDKKRYAEDEFACKNSNVIFAVSKMLVASRIQYNSNIILLGNGADIPHISDNITKKQNSVAFIGNFRDWIDQKLLEGIISKMPETSFAFVGTIEENMREYFDELLKKYQNTQYYGVVDKSQINTIYASYDCIIIPYKDNEFIRATRPIKIVESVLAGTPVVTVPIDGYDECEFIKFANDADSFVEAIKKHQQNGINRESAEYRNFVHQNTWEAKAREILTAFKNKN